MLAKVCVFCGQKPQKKTKEHVIPKWLIALTGDPNRKVALGWDKALAGKELKAREFAFDQLVFPACAACNGSYSKLEDVAQEVLTDILGQRSVEATNLSMFLDWLDKVRVGLWLGFLQLDKNYASIDPTFHIDTRIGQYDRILVVEKTNTGRKRLNFMGVDCLSFSLMPSAFVLAVNNYYFTNVSCQFLLAHRLGFPYPSDERLMPDGRLFSLINEGTNRVKRPVIRRPFRPGGVVIYQPMFKGGLIEPKVEVYDSEYVRENSLDVEGGIGKIFIERGELICKKGRGESCEITPGTVHVEDRHRFEAAVNVFEWQNWLASKLPNLSELDEGQRRHVKKRWRSAKRMNDALISYCKASLKRFFGP
jgi:hypothetical protein